MSFRPGSQFPTPVLTMPTIELASEHTPSTIVGNLRDGTWRRSGRGAYVAAASVGSERRAALARIAATHRRLSADHLFSHESAALLWGLTLWRAPALTHVEQAYVPGGRRDRGVRRHRRGLPLATSTEICGLPVTTLEQTVVDCACSLGPLGGLVVADSGLRAGARRDILGELLSRRAGTGGTRRGRLVIQLADDGSESAWETATRFVALRGGLPVPVTQVPVDTRLGRFWADLGWPEWNLVLEYDGRVKYHDPDVLFREKRRHDAIVEAGRRVLRVAKEDVVGERVAPRPSRRCAPAGRPAGSAPSAWVGPAVVPRLTAGCDALPPRRCTSRCITGANVHRHRPSPLSRRAVSRADLRGEGRGAGQWRA